jgi:hypothetical protein
MSGRQTPIVLSIAVIGLVLLAGVVYFTAQGASAPMGGWAVPAGTAVVEARDQQGIMSSLNVARVVAPERAWLVVSPELADGSFGQPMALAQVMKGETVDIPITLYGTGVMPASTVPARVRITLVSDRGRLGQLEQDAADPAASPDKPFVIDGRAVSATIALKPYGVPVPAGTAVIEGARLLPGGATLTIDHVVAPKAAVIVVTSGGAQFLSTGAIVAEKQVPAGDSRNVVIKLGGRAADLALIATLFSRAPDGAAVEGYMVDGAIVATPVSTR